MEYMIRLQDAAYDEGYDDALAGRPKKNAGDLHWDYDAGYDDGLQDQLLGQEDYDLTDYDEFDYDYFWVEDDEGSHK
jgi:hypothetical protein